MILGNARDPTNYHCNSNSNNTPRHKKWRRRLNPDSDTSSRGSDSEIKINRTDQYLIQADKTPGFSSDSLSESKKTVSESSISFSSSSHAFSDISSFYCERKEPINRFSDIGSHSCGLNLGTHNYSFGLSSQNDNLGY